MENHATDSEKFTGVERVKDQSTHGRVFCSESEVLALQNKVSIICLFQWILPSISE